MFCASCFPARLLAFILILLLDIDFVRALITGNIKIVTGVGAPQFLPGSYINTFPRWTLENDSSSPSNNLKRLVGTGIPSNNNNDDSIDDASSAQQFANPSSNAELWWPSDIKQLQIRPTVDFMIKSGMATYVLAGIEVRVPPDASKDGKVWKNYGMNSQLLADQWTAFNIAVEEDFRIECFLGEMKVANSPDDTSTLEWRPLGDGDVDSAATCDDDHNVSAASVKTLKAIQTLGEILANLDEASPIADGMHIVSIPVQEKWINLPPPLLNEDENDQQNKIAYKLSCVATSESDAKEMLLIDDELLSMSATSLLRVDVELVSPGSESEYLPEAYRPLYMSNN